MHQGKLRSYRILYKLNSDPSALNKWNLSVKIWGPSRNENRRWNTQIGTWMEQVKYSSCGDTVLPLSYTSCR